MEEIPKAIERCLEAVRTHATPVTVREMMAVLGLSGQTVSLYLKWLHDRNHLFRARHRTFRGPIYVYSVQPFDHDIRIDFRTAFKAYFDALSATDGLTVRQLATQLDKPYGAVHICMKKLYRLGFVARVPTEEPKYKYELNPQWVSSTAT